MARSARPDKVNITWDRVWTPERLSEAARAKLRLPMEQLLPLREARLRREAEERAKVEPKANDRAETGESR